VALGLHFATYFESVKNTSIAAASVLVNTEVLFVAMATVLVFRRRLGGKAWLAVLMAFGGAMLIALADTTGGGGENALLGDAFALLSSVFMGTYTLLGSVCRRSITTTVYTYLVYSVAMVTVLLLALVSGTPLFGYGSLNYAAALGMAIFCTLLGHSVFSWSLKYLPPALVSTMRQMDPLAAALWGLLLYDERPGILVLVGGVVIICGAVLYSRTTALESKEK
jgi:drug/metabolite transporter (DMT)-like permease